MVDLPAPTHRVTLPGGRVLAADVVGDPLGLPVVHLHGSPDSRFARHPDDSIAERLGVRLIAVDRPGYGDTDPLPPGEGVRAWADDVAVLLDELGVERCRVAAWSAGSHWAWGIAAGRPERVERVLTFGALAAFEDLLDPDVRAVSEGRLAAVDEVVAGRPIAAVLEEIAAWSLPPRPVDLAVARDVYLDGLGPRVRATLAPVPGLLDQLARSLAGAVDRHGTAGMAIDLAIQSSVGMASVLDEVRAPAVLVAGTHDTMSGPAASHALAARLGHAEVVEWPAGHQGLLTEWGRWLELLAAP